MQAIAWVGLLAAVPAQDRKSEEPKVVISQRTAAPLFAASQPWEDFCLSWCSVLRDGGTWHLWYGAFDHTYRDDGDGYLCYARSKDGVRWERPSLGLVEYRGKRDTNILISGPALGGAGMNGTTVFLDEKAPAAERFKFVAPKKSGGEWLIHTGVSPDGLRWTLSERPAMSKTSDTQNACFKDGDRYRLYVRMWTEGLYKGYRTVGYTESPTFGNFPDPVEILRPDAQDPKDLHFYSSAATRLSDSLYLMFPAGYSAREDVVRAHLAYSRNGKDFRRIGRQPAIDLGKGFDSKGVYVAPGAIPGEKPGTFWFYYQGTGAKHDENKPTKVRHDGGIGRFLVTIAD